MEQWVRDKQIEYAWSVANSGPNISYPSRVAAEHIRSTLRGALNIIAELQQEVAMAKKPTQREKKAREIFKRSTSRTGARDDLGPFVHFRDIAFPQLVSVPYGQKAVMVSEEMYGEVDKILKARNSSTDKYIEAQLVKFLNIRLIHGLNDTLTFGQYTGMNVKEICETDLDYMYWLVIEQNSKKFDNAVREYVQRLAQNDLRRND